MPRTSLSVRAQVHSQLDPRAWEGKGLSSTNRLIVGLIFISTALAIVETEPFAYSRFGAWFDAGELLFGVLFLLEYLARLWSIAEDRGRSSCWARRLRFVVSPAGLLDLLVVITSLVPTLGLNASALRLVRLARIARLARVGRMSTALKNLTMAVWLRRYELGVTLAIAVGVLIVGATALYWLEGDVQPDKFGSVPRALWWAVVTLTTIGYGDVYPITPAGKVAASLLAIAGVGLIALPAGIMAGAMHDLTRRLQNSDEAKS